MFYKYELLLTLRLKALFSVGLRYLGIEGCLLHLAPRVWEVFYLLFL